MLETSIQAKKLESDSLKSIIKKLEEEIKGLKIGLAEKEEAVYHFHQ